MSVLETFYILFKSDADKLKADVEGAEKAAEGLADAFGEIGDIDASGMQKLDAALVQAKADADSLAATAARLKFDGRPGAEQMANEAKRAKLEAQELSAAVKQAKIATEGAVPPAKRLGDEVKRAGDETNKAANNAQRLGSTFTGVVRNLVAPLAAAFSVGALVSGLNARIDEIKQLDQMATKLRTSVGDVDAFTKAVRATGGEASAALDTMTKFAEKANEAIADRKSGAAKDFKEWGISLKGVKGQALDTVQGLLALAGNLEKVSRAEALARIKKLGIEDAATIDLLLKGRKALEAAIDAEKRRGVVTEEQAKKAREYKAATADLQLTLEAFGNSLWNKVTPLAIRGLKAMREGFDWLTKNETLVKGFFIGVAGVITAIYLPAIVSALATTLAFLAPFLLIGAAIAGVGIAAALVYEDIMAFLDGQPSLIGELIKQYPMLGEAISALGETFSTLKTLATDAFNALVDLAVSAYNRVTTTWAPIGQLWADVFEALGPLVQTVWDGIVSNTEVFLGKWRNMAGLIAPAFTAAADIVKNVWSGALDLIAKGIDKAVGGLRWLLGLNGQSANINVNVSGTAEAVTAGQQQIGAAAGNPMGAQTPASIAAQGGGGPTEVTNNANVNTGPVTINTQATDAPGIAAAFNKSLNDAVIRTQSQLDDGVDR